MLIFIYILHVCFLILHEIESGFEKEWEILKLPGKINGFILFHIPIIFILFYGLYFMITIPEIKTIISIIAGIAGFIPLVVHKIIVNKKENFNRILSNILIFGNVVSGIALILLGILEKMN